MTQRTFAVSGTSSGLGAALRANLEKRGDRVIGIDLHGAEVIADLSTVEGREAAIAGVTRLCGGGLDGGRLDGGRLDGGRLDGVASVAGIGPHLPSTLIVAVNAFGALALIDGLFPLLSKQPGAACVAVSSNSITLDPTVRGDLVDACVAGDESLALAIAAEVAGNTAYASSKLGVARAIRRRTNLWGEAGVRLNAIAPGPFASALLDASRADETLGPLVDLVPIPLGRQGTADEVAAPIAWLLSDEASWVHGSVLFVDGGTDALIRPNSI